MSLSITGTILTYVVWTMKWEEEAEVTRLRLGTAKRVDEDDEDDDNRDASEDGDERP